MAFFLRWHPCGERQLAHRKTSAAHSILLYRPKAVRPGPTQRISPHGSRREIISTGVAIRTSGSRCSHPHYDVAAVVVVVAAAAASAAMVVVVVKVLRAVMSRHDCCYQQSLCCLCVILCHLLLSFFSGVAWPYCHPTCNNSRGTRL